LQNKKIVGIFIENYLAGGCDKIASDLIDNLNYQKLYLFINKDADLKFIINAKNYKNIEVVTYDFATLHMLGVKANSFQNKNRFLYICLKIWNLFIRYPMMMYFIVYFILLFKKYKINILFSKSPLICISSKISVTK